MSVARPTCMSHHLNTGVLLHEEVSGLQVYIIPSIYGSRCSLGLGRSVFSYRCLWYRVRNIGKQKDEQKGQEQQA
jgi:hypothetical protein